MPNLGSNPDVLLHENVLADCGMSIQWILFTCLPLDAYCYVKEAGLYASNFMACDKGKTMETVEIWVIDRCWEERKCISPF